VYRYLVFEYDPFMLDHTLKGTGMRADHMPLALLRCALAVAVV
jgi:hypothetical protein